MEHRHLYTKARLFGIAGLVAAWIVILGPGASSAGQASIRSAGGASCRVFAEGASPSRQAEAIQWAIGYLSGRITSDPGAWHREFRGTDGIARAVTAYCRRRPYAPVVEAADWFFE